MVNGLNPLNLGEKWQTPDWQCYHCMTFLRLTGHSAKIRVGLEEKIPNLDVPCSGLVLESISAHLIARS